MTLKAPMSDRPSRTVRDLKLEGYSTGTISNTNTKWAHVAHCVICNGAFVRKGTKRKTCCQQCAKEHQKQQTLKQSKKAYREKK